MTGATRSVGRKAFTLIEVVCILLVITVGLVSVLGLVSYGMVLAARTQGAVTGMATAVTVATDPTPWLDPELAADWTYTTYDMDNQVPNATLTSLAEGYVNGYFVERTETSLNAVDIVAVSGATVFIRSASVSVEVYETLKGSRVASYTTQILRQRGTP